MLTWSLDACSRLLTWMSPLGQHLLFSMQVIAHPSRKTVRKTRQVPCESHKVKKTILQQSRTPASETCQVAKPHMEEEDEVHEWFLPVTIEWKAWSSRFKSIATSLDMDGSFLLLVFGKFSPFNDDESNLLECLRKNCFHDFLVTLITICCTRIDEVQI